MTTFVDGGFAKAGVVKVVFALIGERHGSSANDTAEELCFIPGCEIDGRVWELEP